MRDLRAGSPSVIGGCSVMYHSIVNSCREGLIFWDSPKESTRAQEAGTKAGNTDRDTRLEQVRRAPCGANSLLSGSAILKIVIGPRIICPAPPLTLKRFSCSFNAAVPYDQRPRPR